MGDHALDNIPNELEELGATRPFLITDRGIEKAGLVRLLVDAFSESGMGICGSFSDVPPDSDKDTVAKAAQAFRASRCDSIIALGGGSVIDTAKGMNILVTEESDDLLSFAGSGILRHRLKPFIAVPTTAGTGSEVTLMAVIMDTQDARKMVFLSRFLMPDTAVLDPRMTVTLPPLLTAATAMDALTHAIEAYTCLGKNPMSDAYSVTAIRYVMNNLPAVLEKPEDKIARLNLAAASTMAGIAFSNSLVGLVHTLGHATGAVCHVHHGIAMNIFLPVVLEYNIESIRPSLGELLLPLSGTEVFAATPPEKCADETIVRLRSFRNSLFEKTGLPRTLRETGNVTKQDFPAIAHAALNDASIVYNPVEMDREDALKLLEKAFED